MSNQKQTVLIINGAEPSAYSRGEYNAAMADAAQILLQPHFTVLTTKVANGYDVAEEIDKFKAADVVIYQYPVFWFMVPAALKKYMDDVFAYGEFFSYTDGPYGSGGMMQGKQVLISTTWNAPEDAFNDKAAFFGGASASDAILPMRKAHAYCGFGELAHFSVHNVVRDPQFEANKARFLTHLCGVFNLAEGSAAA